MRRGQPLGPDDFVICADEKPGIQALERCRPSTLPAPGRNGASHQPKTFPDRLRRLYPNAIAVHLSKHASWLNQVELYFSTLQRKLLKRIHVTSRSSLSGLILDVQRHYNRTAKPFRWGFTARDLRQRLASLTF